MRLVYLVKGSRVPGPLVDGRGYGKVDKDSKEATLAMSITNAKMLDMGYKLYLGSYVSLGAGVSESRFLTQAGLGWQLSRGDVGERQ